MRHATPRGFTLVEVLGVVVIVAVLAAIAMSRLGRARERAEEVVMVSDLKNLAIEQETHRVRLGSYAPNLGDLSDFKPSPGVVITLTQVDGGRGWAAVAHHARQPRKLCGVYYGSADAADAFPAVVAGIAACAEIAETPSPSPEVPRQKLPEGKAPITVTPAESQPGPPSP